MKLPFIKFYPGDWLKDPQLSFCSPATRGVWIDLICAMHELGRVGELRGTAEQLARVARCQPAEFVQAMTDLQTTGAADVTERNGEITVRNRRITKEEKARKDGAFRQERLRCNAKSNGDVTPYISEVRSQKSEKEEDEEPSATPVKNRFSEAIQKLREGHIAFKVVPDVSLENAFKAWPIERWNEAIESLCHRYAGANIPRPIPTLENHLAGKGREKIKALAQERKPSVKESWDKSIREVLRKLEESALSGGDAISRCLSTCNDLYRDVPKQGGRSVVDEAYEIFKFRNRTKSQEGEEVKK